MFSVDTIFKNSEELQCIPKTQKGRSVDTFDKPSSEVVETDEVSEGSALTEESSSEETSSSSSSLSLDSSSASLSEASSSSTGNISVGSSSAKHTSDNGGSIRRLAH